MSIITNGHIKSLRLDKGFAFVRADGKDVYVPLRLLRDSGYRLDLLAEDQEIALSFEETEPGKYRAREVLGIPTGTLLKRVPAGVHSGTIKMYDDLRGFGFISVGMEFLDLHFKTWQPPFPFKKGTRVTFHVDFMGEFSHFAEELETA